jgi:uncharacterized membrane protein SirB2
LVVLVATLYLILLPLLLAPVQVAVQVETLALTAIQVAAEAAMLAAEVEVVQAELAETVLLILGISLMLATAVQDSQVA